MYHCISRIVGGQRLLDDLGKELKQRFSRWYNKRMERFGTLWAERFTSVVVEDSTAALRTVAAYIDLNPIRAELARGVS